jgi:hypothetical protein
MTKTVPLAGARTITRVPFLLVVILFGWVCASTTGSSVFTDLSACVALPALDQPQSPGWSCPGVGGYTVRISRDDNTAYSMRIDRLPNGGSTFVARVRANFWRQKHQKLEWRILNGAVVGLIVQLPSPVLHRFNVVGLSASHACVGAEVPTWTLNAHARALALVDRGCRVKP